MDKKITTDIEWLITELMQDFGLTEKEAIEKIRAHLIFIS